MQQKKITVIQDKSTPPASRKRRTKYPFDKMEVNSYFVLRTMILARSIAYNATGRAKKLNEPKEFVARNVNGECRVYRSQ